MSKLWYAFAALVVVLCAGFYAQVRCERDHASSITQESGDVTRVLNLEDRVTAIEKQLQEQFRDPSPLIASRSPFHWWCHAGHSTCFRDRDECARKHAQGLAGCEPRRIAYCNGQSCYADLNVCQLDERTGKFTRFCVGVE